MKQFLKTGIFVALVLACAVAAVALFWPALKEMSNTSIGGDSLAGKAPASRPVSVTASGEWNTYHGDAALTGVAEAAFSDALRVVWTAITGAPVERPPVISKERVFAVTTTPEVLAFDLNGQQLWRYAITAQEGSETALDTVYVDAPIAVFQNTVFVGTDMGLVLALQADTGERIWQYQLDSPVHGSPNYSAETGLVYILEQDTGALVGLELETGALRWRSETVDRADGSPAIDEGVAVYGSCASALHVLDADSGAVRHAVTIDSGGGQVAGGVALVDGFAYAGCRDGRVMRADLEKAAFVWLTSVSASEVFSTPAVKETWVLVTALDGVLYALDRETGEQRWEHSVGGEPGSPVIADGNVIVTSEDTLFLVHLQDGKRLWDMRMAGYISDPAVLSNLIVVGCEDGTLIALSQ